jgi:hypothetical protein
MKEKAPWILAILALLAVYPASRIGQEKPAAKLPQQEAPPEAPKPAVADETCLPRPGNASPPPWCEPVRALLSAFGQPLDPAAPRSQSLLSFTREARAAGYGLEFLVALVPDPRDSGLAVNFDEALDAIQQGFAQSDYLMERFWLPWAGGDGKGYRQSPGLLLFRKRGRMAAVFLVGETPKRGIHREAFAQALDLIGDLQGVAAGDRSVGVLGPSFSGSAESLRMGLSAWNRGELEPAEGGGNPRLRFRIATGGATTAGLENTFQGYEFCRTIVPNAELQNAVFSFLASEMGWDPAKVALLIEADTAYGRSVLRKKPRPHENLVLVQFPSHVSHIRNAWEEDAGKEPRQETLEERLRSSRPALDLSLGDRSEPVDLVPTFSPLTTPAKDLELSNLLETISREGIRYVGIVATDAKDRLFLADRIRRFAPDTVLFTFENSLLYAHPKVGETMDETLVFTSAPLFTEGAPWLPASTEAGGRQRRQFTGEYQQGVLQALRWLLRSPGVSRPHAWIAAVGNGSLWPIARLPVPEGEARLCGALLPASLPPEDTGGGPAGKSDLQILLVALVLCLFSVWLRRTALLQPVPGAMVDTVPWNRRLLAAGSALLAAAAGVLLVVGGVPYWAWGLDTSNLLSFSDVTQTAYLIALALAYVYLVRNAVLAARGRVGRWEWIGWDLAGILVLVVLGAAVRWMWMPGDQIASFFLRARAFSSGLSPLIGLAALGAGLYAWVLLELERRRLMARQATDCPLEALCEPAVAGCGDVLSDLRGLLTQTIPSGAKIWILPATAFIPPAFLLWWTVQPIAERQAYGRFFLLFLLLTLSLVALAFYRFIRLWQGMHHILRRLDNASPAQASAFEAISKELAWRPMKSFGWSLPPFRMLVLSTARLEELAAAGRIAPPEPPDVPLTGVFEHEERDGGTKEIEHRNRLEAIFAKACLELRSQAKEPQVREFLALRVAAYLRYVFAHMRSCLLAAMIPGLLVLIAVTSYAFEPKQFVSLAIWTALGVAVALTLWAFLQMDRNTTLSRIGGTTPGQVTFDGAFLTNLFTYVGIPLLGIVATQFPKIGELLGRVADQLLRVAGGG